MNILLSIIFVAQVYLFSFHLQDEKDPNAFFKFLGRASGVAAVAALFATITNFTQFIDSYFQAALWGGIGWAAVWVLSHYKGGDAEDPNHLRGSKVVSSDTLQKRLKTEESNITIGEVPIPQKAEDRSFLLAGAPGSGKSQAIQGILDKLAGKGQRAVIADTGGIFWERYCGQSADEKGYAKDVLLNPFDARSMPWSPLAEIESVEDCASLTKSMIPDGHGSASEWNGYAQTFVQPLLEYCWTERLSNADLFNLACITPISELRQVLTGTPAAPMVEAGNSEMFGSVRAIVSSYLKAYQYLSPEAGVDSFSIRNYLKSGEGWLFITYKQTQRDALRPIIQAALDIASRTVLDLPPATGDRTHQKKTWFILDEFPLLGKVQSIETLLTNGSKHGSVVLAAIQTVAQMRDAYGHDKSQTLLSTLGTWLCLRSPDAETSEYMSKSFGEAERKRIVQSGGESKKAGFAGNWAGGKNKNDNWQEQINTSRTILPSELQNLPDLCGYLNIAGDYPICPVKLPIVQSLPPAAPAFVAAPPRARVKVDAPAPATPAASVAEAHQETDVFTL